MQVNLPISQREFELADDTIIVSTTDLQGRITHCNRAFEAASGYSYDELIGQPHSIVRHPDMPPEGFADLWATIGRGRPWTGVVKNRRKNGDHYWVQANVTPIMEGRKPKAYMSVRFKPSRAAVAGAEALYARIAEERSRGRPTFTLHAGAVRQLGWRDWLGKLKRLSMTQRLAAGLLVLSGASLLPAAWGLHGSALLWTQLTWWAVGSAALLTWYHSSFSAPVAEADRFAGDVAGCNLSTQVDVSHSGPLAPLTRRLWQIQLNLRATVGDVRDEIDRIRGMTDAVAQSSQNLSARTEAQARNLEHTASHMTQLAQTVRQTADTAAQVYQQSEQCTAVAQRGGDSVQQVGHSMQAIEESSRKVSDIIGVIEGIAFQTNILALNAAVEAARAGEQGRGFAVVASEVRSLAQRSATAAKEIRELIGASVQQVADGARQMHDSGHTIGEVVTSVAQVSALVQTISNATRDQSNGIGQVNQAVAELEEATQQNAALGEASVASAQSLHDSTVTLARAVQIFRLGQ